MTPSEAGIPRPAPSAADLAATVRRGIRYESSALALDALLARCEEAERLAGFAEKDGLAPLSAYVAKVKAAEARVAELEAALHEITCIGWARPDRMVRVANDALAGLASPQEPTT